MTTKPPIFDTYTIAASRVYRSLLQASCHLRSKYVTHCYSYLRLLTNQLTGHRIPHNGRANVQFERIIWLQGGADTVQAAR
jgi:hypothetical protein